MAQEHGFHPELLPTREWIESAGIQESLDQFSQTPLSHDINKKIKAARAKPLPKDKSDKLIAILVEAIVLILGVNPASCPEAMEDCIEICVKNNILKPSAWRDLPFVRSPDRISARLLDEQALATKKQLALPFPEVGMLMVVTLLLKLDRGTKNTTSRAIKQHFLFQRAKMAALVYDRDTCSGIFAISNCPKCYSFTEQADGRPPTAARTTTSGPDDEFKWLRLGEANREIATKDNDSSSDYSPPGGKPVTGESAQRTLLRPAPGTKQEPTAKQTSNIHGTSRPIIHTSSRETKRRRISISDLFGSPTRFPWVPKTDFEAMRTSRRQERSTFPTTTAAPPPTPERSDAGRNGNNMSVSARARVLDDGRPTMEPDAAQKMFDSFRAIKEGLVKSDTKAAVDAYNQMVSTFPEGVRDKMDLTTVSGDTLAQGKLQRARARKISTNFGRVSKALEEVDEGVAIIRASLAHEHHAIRRLKQMLLSLEDELE
ncbi:unnamed protein product [Clonostachys rosea]|uniref:Uncharacterized protein n=1 Tax=Bionectria ochroleuca TaxID=29856 RepID=A0ABY6UFE2_BIOOC|nr:unnamed protein product [Clonostachys rosea]